MHIIGMKSLILYSNFIGMKQLLFIIFFGVLLSASAQNELYMPKEIKQAYDAGSRKYDGSPGLKYFQNRTDYDIQVHFDPDTYLLTGTETVTYHNNSHNDLEQIIVRNYQDIFAKGNPRAYRLDGEDINDGVKITRFEVNGKPIDFEQKVQRYSTNMYIELPTKISAGKKSEIIIDWEVFLPSETNIRYGAYEGSYFIAYWFPRIAVYDDIDGWNSHIHNLQQEYYNEFGDFRVAISVPRNYLVWASGVLENPEEIYSDEILKRYRLALESDHLVHIIDTLDYKNDLLFTKNDHPELTWKYHSYNLTDFSFAISQSYLWDAISVQLDPESTEKTLINAVYNKKSADFYEVATIARDVITSLSKNVTGHPYPYPSMTVFNGHGGMEFPMMVNDGSSRNRDATIHLTAHEICHTWFPFLVGSNEQRYAFIDEGLVTFLPKEVEMELSETNDFNPFIDMVAAYEYYAGGFVDVPMSIPTNHITGRSYRFQAYSRPAVAYMLLKDYLGKDTFNQCLTEYISRWKGKHPTPYDLFYTFNEVSGENLNWFWSTWFLEIGYPDLELTAVEQEENQYTIIVSKKGKLPVPAIITVEYEDGDNDIIRKGMDTWLRSDQLFIYLPKFKKIKSVTLGNETIPDIYKDNNSIQY